MKGQFYFIAVFIVIGAILSAMSYMEVLQKWSIEEYYSTDKSPIKAEELQLEINTALIASNANRTYVYKVIDALKEIYDSRGMNLSLNVTTEWKCELPGKPVSNGTDHILTISRDCLEENKTQKVDGELWDSRDTINLYLYDEDGNLWDSKSVTANRWGRFTKVWRLDNIPPGFYYIKAVSSSTGITRTVSFQIIKSGKEFVDPNDCDYSYKCSTRCTQIAYINYTLDTTVSVISNNYTICWRS